MRIADLYRAGGPVFSFEFFPPKTPAGWRTLYRTIADLAELRPAFVSVTSHARGENRSQTVELTTRIQNELGILAMAHMTCTGQTQAELGATLDQLKRAGIANVMALRGDAPKDQPEWQPVPGGFRFASELAAFVRERGAFCIGGGCYPEIHPEAADADADLANLERKLAAGAEFLITQLFLDNAHYFRFVARARAAGVTAPIVPGIMPIVSLANLRGALRNAPNSEVPRELERALADAEADKERSLDVGVEWATLQCRELLTRGAPGVHFYTLNQSPATRRVHANLTGAKP
ncbi:MAG TPA: methylenetetrahydrofolate reductase [NAD(P)H] [Myxococcota bacterium]|nr:methylenetetrahydrofolate reductase [NAD(P)H] [Myxococcota bacterium]